MKHSSREWFGATRYWSFPVSVMPVVVTFTYLLSRGLVPAGAIPVVCAVLALTGAVVIHAAGNLLSDWADHRTGVDNADAFAVPNLVFGKFTPREYLVFSIVLFAVGAGIGIALTIIAGWRLLIIGVPGIILTAGYSFLKYHALGDLDIFIIFSVLIILGTGYVVTGGFVPESLVLALPVGIITVSVLHANNTRDMETDRKAGIKSFAMLIGGKASCILYIVYMVIPFAAVISAVIFRFLSPFALLCLPAAIPAWKNARQAAQYREKGIGAMTMLDLGSAKLQLVFSVLLSIGLAAGAVAGI